VTNAGATEAICRKRVGLVPDAIRHSFETFAAKALLMQLRFGYTASPEVRHLIQMHQDANTLVYESHKVFPQLPLMTGLHHAEIERTWDSTRPA
jgi:hypothetical protein